MKRMISLLLLICLLTPAACADSKGRVLEAFPAYTGPENTYPRMNVTQQVNQVVTVHTKVYDSQSRAWWVQVEFNDGVNRYRLYTPAHYLDVDLTKVPDEAVLSGNSYVSIASVGRLGPGESYAVCDQAVRKYTSCAVLEAENDYVLIDTGVDGQTMDRLWLPIDAVSNGYLFAGQDTYATTLLENAADKPNQRGNWCRIIAGSANVRYNAGTEYAIAAYVQSGQQYQILDEKTGTNGSQWYQIKVDGAVGWISSGLVDVTSSASVNSIGGGSANTPAWPIGEKVRVIAESAKLRCGPGTEFDVTGYVNRGERYIVLDHETSTTGRKWYKINQDGLIAWLSSGVVEILD